jgi:nitrogen-specific signal transduction histidine kinase
MSKDDAQITSISHQALTTDTSGNPVSIMDNNHESTARKKVEKESLDDEARFRECLENMICRIGLYSALRDESGEIVDFVCEFVNKAVCLAHGKTKKELIGRRMSNVWDDAKGILLAEYRRVCETGEPYSSEEFYYDNGKKDLLSGVYEVQVSKWGDGVAVSSRNVSEKKNLEAQLARLDRLNLVGEMAASIGHEIRNPLTTVRGYLQLFQRKEQYADHKEQFGIMIEELDRANAIITEYLSLAKNKTVELKLGNVNSILTVLYPLLQADAYCYGHDIRLEKGTIPDILLDEKEIRQLVLNLVRNGHEAMLSGGTVTIKTYFDNDKVIVAFQDTGPGMLDEVLSKLGTPFLTTKENGTGL